MHPLVENLQTLLVRVPFSPEQLGVIRMQVKSLAGRHVGSDMERVEHLLVTATRNSVGQQSVGNDARAFVSAAVIALFLVSLQGSKTNMELYAPAQAANLLNRLVKEVFGITTHVVETTVFYWRGCGDFRTANFYEFAAKGNRPNPERAKVVASQLQSKM